MDRGDVMIFKKRPQSFLAALRGLLILNNRYHQGKPHEPVRAEWRGAGIDEAHLKNFNDFFGLPGSGTIPFLYPYTLFFPIYMRMLTDRKAPVTIFKTLNTRNHILQHRTIGKNEILDIQCETSPCRVLPKGIEMDITTVIKSRGETLWENINTFYYRGKYGDPEPGYTQPALEKIPDPRELVRWHLPDGQGYRFSKIIGDSNPIHYWGPYARLFGFRRDFAQPFHVLNRSLNCLPGIAADGREELRTLLKGPVYYNSTVVLVGTLEPKRHRFDIYSGDNELPCISVERAALK